MVGFAFPGVPGVQHFAHAGEVAWAITNAMADYQDVYAERLRRVDGRVQALGPDGWEPVRTRTEQVAGPRRRAGARRGAGDPARAGVLRRGRRGRRAEPARPPRRSWATSASTRCCRCCGPAPSPTWTPRSTPGSSPSTTWSSPTVHGDVLYRVAGRVPVRPEGNRLGVVDAADPSTAWTGWLDPLPRTDGRAGRRDRHRQRAPRARERPRSATTFAPPHRAARLRALLGRAGRPDRGRLRALPRRHPAAGPRGLPGPPRRAGAR